MKLTVGVERWEGWVPDIREKRQWQALITGVRQPDLTAAPEFLWLKPRQRRRLSMISKMTLDVAGCCAEGVVSIPAIFASRRGEVSRMATILQDICSGEDASPTDFSLSVHNASSGLFSIYTDNRQPSTAIAAGADTVIAGLTEAYAQLNSGQERVLLVFFEDQMPEVYQAFALAEDYPVVLAMILSQGSEPQLQLQISSGIGSLSEAESTYIQLTTLVRTLLTEQSGVITGESKQCLLQFK
ncbi:beta-ketoacyl synthase chain length factor [Endozoicomonas sp. Mp262]|uniref:beta-ketoacyl synthase chain length factor n=1 Tax=Endozoicomonas sp. Mp262 TaxID=2919499 RepID=UPI0021DA693D